MRSVFAVVAVVGSTFIGTHSTTPVSEPMVANGIRTFDPITALPPSVQLQFKCIAYTESRNKLVDTNVVSNAQGMYQFMPEIWQFARANISGLPATPNEATQIQQNSVAYFYWTRNHGLYPEWTDGC